MGSSRQQLGGPATGVASAFNLLTPTVHEAGQPVESYAQLRHNRVTRPHIAEPVISNTSPSPLAAVVHSGGVAQREVAQQAQRAGRGRQLTQPRAAAHLDEVLAVAQHLCTEGEVAFSVGFPTADAILSTDSCCTAVA